MYQLILPGQSGSDVSIEYPAGFQFTDVGSIITKIIPYLFAFAGIGLLFMIISAGFTLLTSAGDEKKTEAGKNRLTYAVVGFIIIFVAYWGVQIAGIVFGYQEILDIFR